MPKKPREGGAIPPRKPAKPQNPKPTKSTPPKPWWKPGT